MKKPKETAKNAELHTKTGGGGGGGGGGGFENEFFEIVTQSRDGAFILGACRIKVLLLQE